MEKAVNQDPKALTTKLGLKIMIEFFRRKNLNKNREGVFNTVSKIYGGYHDNEELCG